MTWLLTGLSILGVGLNIRKSRSCFYVWACTNFAWAVVDYQAGPYAQAVLFMVYFSLAILGIVAWRKGK